MITMICNGSYIKKNCVHCVKHGVYQNPFLLVELKFDSSNYSHLDLDVDPIVLIKNHLMPEFWLCLPFDHHPPCSGLTNEVHWSDQNREDGDLNK